MIQPTPRTVVLVAATVPVALLTVVQEVDWWPLSFNLAVVMVLAFGIDALLAFPRRWLDLAIVVPETIAIGDRGAIVLSFRPTRFRQMVEIAAVAELRGEAEPPQIAETVLEPGAPARLELAVKPLRRGQIGIERISLRWRGPLGLARITTDLPLGRVIDVIPNVRIAQQAVLRFLGRDAPAGIHLKTTVGSSLEFNALGEFVAGHDRRHIDWSHSARHRKLLVKEFQHESNQLVMLAFDTGHLMAEPVNGMPRLDHAINAGMALAWMSLRNGDLAGIFGFDASPRRYLAPMRGGSNFSRVQRAAAELDYHAEETNFTLGLAELEQRLNRRALVVVFTDFVDTVTAELLVESLGRIASRHVVVFVTPRDEALSEVIDAQPKELAEVAQAVVAHDFLRDRRIVLERLERLGVHLIDAPGRDLPVALLSRYLQIKQRALI